MNPEQWVLRGRGLNQPIAMPMTMRGHGFSAASSASLAPTLGGRPQLTGRGLRYNSEMRGGVLPLLPLIIPALASVAAAGVGSIPGIIMASKN
ncbi:pX [Red-eared slider adenovirus 1]|uniref:pX n=1 Tax=Red-eared slider adenovirus 1 TaxID=2749458 RepID=UPI002481D294|nr:pX [Red-eared slider adenovirus 1]QLD29004.1 pX [Red-eared slider adenovirus 1]